MEFADQFQFQQGAIWTASTPVMSFTPSCFKSCKVQFEHQPSSRCKSPDRGFNSSKVQFELKMDNNEKMPFEVSIPVWCNLNYRWGGCCQGCFCVSIPVRYNLNMAETQLLEEQYSFNSSKVQFEPHIPRMEKAGDVCFNSSKVQFEQWSIRLAAEAKQVSIPARYNLNVRMEPWNSGGKSFNSSKVQFEHEALERRSR